MSKKKKFDLTTLVSDGSLKENETLFFVSDPSKTCTVQRQPNGEYKVAVGKETLTVHAIAQKWLGTEPPMHATKWVRTQSGATLYDLWQGDSLSEAA